MKGKLTVATTATKNQENNQSVYIADKDLVKIYPREMTNEQINYDVHLSKGNSAEDYHVNFLPLTEVQKGWENLNINAPEILKELATPFPLQVAKGVGAVLKAEEEFVTPAMKLIVSDPAYALGFSKDINNPEALSNTYKPWLEIWRESTIGKAATGISDRALAEQPLAVAAIPWFLTEFAPGELLDFGTKASSWVGAFGIEKFGPPLINATVSKLPEQVRNVLLKDIFAGEKALESEFQTLGISINSKTSEVIRAYKKGAQMVHPDVGGDPNEFIRLKSSFENIMKSRSGFTDKIFDFFRKSTEFKARTEPSVVGLLGNERGTALIPFSEGDIVKVGKQIGAITKISGQIATVNIGGKVFKHTLADLQALPDKFAVNPEYLQVKEPSKESLAQATEVMKEDIENQTGKSLSHKEVIEKSKEAELLTTGISREATLQFEANLLKTRQHLAALAEQNELTPEFLDTLRVVANLGTDIARNLESFKIEAIPEFATVKIKVIKDLIKLGKSSEEILKASKGVDFTNEQSVAKFYRQFVKPKLSEILDEFVYINILSSPVTHIVNSFSNILQLAGLNPLTKLASGAIDYVAFKFTGKERMHYIVDVPNFYKGALNAVPKAFDLAIGIMRGKKHLERPDIKHLPTLSKLVDWGTLKIGKYVPRALEASDVLFRTMIESGEIEVLSKQLGHEPNAKEMAKIEKEAAKRAEYYVFRSKPDAENKSGQGKLLSAIDQLTNAIYRLRAVPGLKWFIRFVQTPMNIIKQGIEYSPAGVTTLFGSKDKAEQAGKTIIGSMVFASASWLAANNMTTWSAPKGEKEKNEFMSAGLQPYSLKVGDKWISYSKLGPLSYPIAMAAALHYFLKDSPNALSDSEMDKLVDAFTGLMKFFSDQSYMQGLGDLVSFAKGEKTKAVASVPTQLIPLSSLQGWVNNIIDPIQRKAEKGLSFKSILDQIQMKIVGMSQFVPPQTDIEEAPVKKKLRGINAVSPMRMSELDKAKFAEYQESVKIKQELNKIKKELGSK